jgi:hypothetical protein
VKKEKRVKNEEKIGNNNNIDRCLTEIAAAFPEKQKNRRQKDEKGQH